MKRTLIIAISVLSLALLGAGCYGTTNSNPIVPPGQNQPPANLPAPVGVVPTPLPITNNQPPAINTPPAPVPLKVAVSISGFSFSPSALTVKKGTTVVWTNNDPVGHTITADNGTGPASNLLNTGEAYSFTFDTVGTYAYHCNIHRSMQGSVTVTP